MRAEVGWLAGSGYRCSLVLNDLNYTLREREIDWDYFWKMADQGDWIKGCHLLFAMCFYYFKTPVPNQIQYIDSVPETIIRNAALLSLQNPEIRDNLAFQISLETQHAESSGLKNKLNLIIPKRHVLAQYAGIPLDSLRLWLYYPAWLIKKLWQRIFTQKSSNLTDNIERYLSIQAWLKP